MKAAAAGLLTAGLLGAGAALADQVADDALLAAYLSAVKDASVAEPAEVTSELARITPENQTLVWSAEKDRVLVVTWTSWNGYDNSVGGEVQLGRETWVTVVPELRQHCSAVPAEQDLVLRMEQMLGLPPRNGKTKLVQMWAKPGDMFRPAPDPEVDDDQAELEFPVSSRLSVASTHVDWFNDLKSKSYGDKGYPWTRLGYTYDWGDPASEVGLSEFVVEKGASVLIEGVYPTDQYCQRNPS